MDIADSRRKLRYAVPSFLFMALFALLYDDPVIVISSLGILYLILAVGTFLIQFRGTITSMELSNEDLILNYEYILTNRKKEKRIKLHEIFKMAYSPFRMVVTIKCSKKTFRVSVENADKTSVRAFIEVVKKR